MEAVRFISRMNNSARRGELSTGSKMQLRRPANLQRPTSSEEECANRITTTRLASPFSSRDTPMNFPAPKHFLGIVIAKQLFAPPVDNPSSVL